MPPSDKPNDDRAPERGATAGIPDNQGGLEKERLALEWERLRSERQKLALEFRFKRQELVSRSDKSWKELLANPFVLLIGGAIATAITTLFTHQFNVRETLALEEKKAALSAKAEENKAEATARAADQALQADLIKKFVDGSDIKTVRGNLRFLIEAGLIDDKRAAKIKNYLDNNPDSAPQVGMSGGGLAPGPVSLINATIASIASSRLSARARAAVSQLLDGRSLVEVADWLDQNARQPQYAFLRRLRFVDVPREAKSVIPDEHCKQGACAIGGIERYLAVLKNKSETKQARVDALRILVALVSDIHRPLHVAYADDYGGNAIRLADDSGARNLHELWDTMPVIQYQVDHHTRQLLARLNPQEIAEIESLSSPLEWAQETFLITVRIYSELSLQKEGDRRFVAALPPDYIPKNIPTVEKQIVRAGLRIAKLLNSTLE